MLISPNDSTERGAAVVWHQQRKWGGKQAVPAKFIELRGKQSVRIDVGGKEHTVNKKHVYLDTQL